MHTHHVHFYEVGSRIIGGLTLFVGTCADIMQASFPHCNNHAELVQRQYYMQVTIKVSTIVV
jgi:hypothetical protein